MTKTQEIVDFIVEDWPDIATGNKRGNVIENPNHMARRMFRLWCDGSYNGESHYRDNIALWPRRVAGNKPRRAFVINQFCNVIAREFDCSHSTAQRAMVAAFALKQWDLEKLNAELIEDAADILEID